MPVLCLLLLAVVQIAVVVRDQLATMEAARSAVRAAAVSLDPQGAAAEAAATSLGGAPARVSTSVAGDYVTVTVSLSNATDVPMIGGLLPDVVVRSSSTMIFEPP